MWPPAGRKSRQSHFPSHLTKGCVASRVVSLSQVVSQTCRKDHLLSKGPFKVPIQPRRPGIRSGPFVQSPRLFRTLNIGNAPVEPRPNHLRAGVGPEISRTPSGTPGCRFPATSRSRHRRRPARTPIFGHRSISVGAQNRLCSVSPVSGTTHMRRALLRVSGSRSEPDQPTVPISSCPRHLFSKPPLSSIATPDYLPECA